MTFYARMQALADSQIAAKGAALTIRGVPTAGDPVTGAAAADGTSRTVNGVVTKVDYRTFPETMTQAGDLMLLLDADADVGEVWVRSDASEWTIKAVQKLNFNESDLIAVKALVRG